MHRFKLWNDIYSKSRDDQLGLHKACEKGHFQIVKYLISQKVDLNAKNKSRQTPLYVACNRNNFTIAQMLIESGADITISDKKCITQRN